MGDNGSVSPGGATDLSGRPLPRGNYEPVHASQDLLAIARTPLPSTKFVRLAADTNIVRLSASWSIAPNTTVVLDCSGQTIDGLRLLGGISQPGSRLDAFSCTVLNPDDSTVWARTATFTRSYLTFPCAASDPLLSAFPVTAANSSYVHVSNVTFPYSDGHVTQLHDTTVRCRSPTALGVSPPLVPPASLAPPTALPDDWTTPFVWAVFAVGMAAILFACSVLGFWLCSRRMLTATPATARCTRPASTKTESVRSRGDATSATRNSTLSIESRTASASQTQAGSSPVPAAVPGGVRGSSSPRPSPRHTHLPGASQHAHRSASASVREGMAAMLPRGSRPTRSVRAAAVTRHQDGSRVSQFPAPVPASHTHTQVAGTSVSSRGVPPGVKAAAAGPAATRNNPRMLPLTIHSDELRPQTPNPGAAARAAILAAERRPRGVGAAARLPPSTPTVPPSTPTVQPSLPAVPSSPSTTFHRLEQIGHRGPCKYFRGLWHGIESVLMLMEFTDVAKGDNQKVRLVGTEAALACSISHANILGSYVHEIEPLERSQEDGAAAFRLYLVQEFCCGGSLEHFVAAGHLEDREGALNWKRLLSILSQVAAGMAHVHRLGLVHGCLCPANVQLKLESPGEERVRGSATTPWRPRLREAAAALDEGLCSCKLTNFSMEVQLCLEDDRHAAQAADVTYCAPELLRDRVLASTGDQYSFGVLMWEMWMRRRAFHRGGDQLWPDRHFGHFPRSTPVNYALLTLACLSLDPTSRPPFTQIVEVLQGLEADLLAGAYPDITGTVQATAQLAACAREPVLDTGCCLSAMPIVTPVGHERSSSWKSLNHGLFATASSALHGSSDGDDADANDEAALMGNLQPSSTSGDRRLRADMLGRDPLASDDAEDEEARSWTSAGSDVSLIVRRM